MSTVTATAVLRAVFSPHGIRQMASQIRHAERRLQDFRRVAMSIRNMGLGATMFGTLPTAYAIKGFADYEDALLDIQKVFPGTEAEFDKVKQSIKDMSAAVPLARQEIAKLVEDAAKSNVAKTADGFEKYVTVASQFAVAFGMPIAQSSETLAKLKSALGITIPELRSLGDVMNYVANNSATSEKEVTEQLRRVQSLAKLLATDKDLNLNLAQIRDVIGISAAQTAMGVREEVAATGLRTLLIRLKTLPADTRKALKILRIDTQKFAKLMNEDVGKSFDLLFGKIRELPRERQEAVLQWLGGMKAFDAVAPLLANANEYNRIMALANDTTSSANSMLKEYERRITGTNAHLTMMTNALKNMRDALVGAWAPEIKDATDWVRDFTQSLSNQGGLAKALGAVVGIAAIAGPVLSTVGLSALGIAALVQAFSWLGPAVLAATAALGPFGLAVAGIGAAAAVAYNYWDELFGIFETLKSEALGAAGEMSGLFSSALMFDGDGVVRSFNALMLRLIGHGKAAFEAMPEGLREKLKEAADIFRDTIASAVQSIAGMFDGLLARLRSAFSFIVNSAMGRVFGLAPETVKGGASVPGVPRTRSAADIAPASGPMKGQIDLTGKVQANVSGTVSGHVNTTVKVEVEGPGRVVDKKSTGGTLSGALNTGESMPDVVAP